MIRAVPSTHRWSDPLSRLAAGPCRESPGGTARLEDTQLAIDIRQPRRAAAIWTKARELFAGLVEAHQRRALADRLSVISRDASEADRGRPGRVRQSLHAYRIVSGGVAVRGLVHQNSHQWLPRPAQGARRRERWLVPSGEVGAAHDAAVDGGRARGREPRGEGALHASGGHALRPRWIASTAVNGPSSCCATTATVRLGK